MCGRSSRTPLVSEDRSSGPVPVTGDSERARTHPCRSRAGRLSQLCERHAPPIGTRGASDSTLPQKQRSCTLERIARMVSVGTSAGGSWFDADRLEYGVALGDIGGGRTWRVEAHEHDPGSLHVKDPELLSL